MGSLDAELVQQPGGITGHVVEVVDGGPGPAEHPGVEVDPAAAFRREPNVAVVEADHMEAPIREQSTEVLVPAQQLHTEPHD